jgi:hypothetical protein
VLLVLQREMEIGFRDSNVSLKAGEVFVVPRAVVNTGEGKQVGTLPRRTNCRCTRSETHLSKDEVCGACAV